MDQRALCGGGQHGVGAAEGLEQVLDVGELEEAGEDAEQENNRYQAARQLAERFNATVVLKGAGSLVASKENLWVCANGNPGMATAGMGDVLTGVIAALIGQGNNATESALIGTVLHAAAGDLSAEQNGQRGMLASDLFNPLRQLINR